MWECPICAGTEKIDEICCQCGFDERGDFIGHRTVCPVSMSDIQSRIQHVKTIDKSQYEGASDEKHQALEAERRRNQELEKKNLSLEKENQALTEKLRQLENKLTELRQPETNKTVSGQKKSDVISKNIVKQYGILLAMLPLILIVWTTQISSVIWRAYGATYNTNYYIIYQVLASVFEGCLRANVTYSIWTQSKKFNLIWNIIYIVCQLWTVIFFGQGLYIIIPVIVCMLVGELVIFVLKKIIGTRIKAGIAIGLSAGVAVVASEFIIPKVFREAGWALSAVPLMYVAVEIAAAFIMAYIFNKLLSKA